MAHHWSKSETNNQGPVSVSKYVGLHVSIWDRYYTYRADMKDKNPITDSQPAVITVKRTQWPQNKMKIIQIVQ